jgi:ribosome recycling factor
MADQGFDLKEIEKRMRGALAVLKNEFGGLRTGRASASLLDPIMVNAYGSKMPINQVATVSVPEARMISVSVWDKALVAATDKAIRESDLGLNPIVDGTTLRLPIPEMNQERRTKLSKIASGYAEQARISVRNVRRDGMDLLKRLEKDSSISEDEHHSLSAKVQDLTDKVIKEIDSSLASKENEIMQV